MRPIVRIRAKSDLLRCISPEVKALVVYVFWSELSIDEDPSSISTRVPLVKNTEAAHMIYRLYNEQTKRVQEDLDLLMDDAGIKRHQHPM
jgi:hypothetical protein